MPGIWCRGGNVRFAQDALYVPLRTTWIASLESTPVPTTDNPSALDFAVPDWTNKTIRPTVPNEQNRESTLRREFQRRFERVVKGGGGGNDGGSSSRAIKMLFYYYRVVAGKTQTKLPVAAAINSDTVLSALPRTIWTKILVKKNC